LKVKIVGIIDLGATAIKAARKYVDEIETLFLYFRIDPGRMDRVFISVIVFSVQVANKLELEYK
jgi:hypothetical protein